MGIGKAGWAQAGGVPGDGRHPVHTSGFCRKTTASKCRLHRKGTPEGDIFHLFATSSTNTVSFNTFLLTKSLSIQPELQTLHHLHVKRNRLHWQRRCTKVPAWKPSLLSPALAVGLGVLLAFWKGISHCMHTQIQPGCRVARVL